MPAPARPSRRRGAAPVVLLALAALATACTGAEEQPRAERDRPSAAAVATPAPPPDPCTLTLASGTVPLTADEAVRATDLAAAAVRGDDAPAALAPRLREVAPLAAVTTAAAPALLGREGPALTCAHPRAADDDAEPGRRGLTPRADALLTAMEDAFGALPTGGYAAGGVTSGHVADSSHYDGRAIDVFFRPSSEAAERRRGWTLAQWLVARGDRTALLSVIYRDRIWTSWASSAGWRDYVHPSGNTSDPVLRHLDHVHTAVVGVRRR